MRTDLLAEDVISVVVTAMLQKTNIIVSIVGHKMEVDSQSGA